MGAGFLIAEDQVVEEFWGVCFFGILRGSGSGRGGLGGIFGFGCFLTVFLGSVTLDSGVVIRDTLVNWCSDVDLFVTELAYPCWELLVDSIPHSMLFLQPWPHTRAGISIL